MIDSFWEDKNVLITGHTGFKGSWLSLWLIMLGANVYGYSLEPNENQKLFKQIFAKKEKINGLPGQFNHKLGDVKDFKSLQNYVKIVKPECVFHLAAESTVRKSYKEPIKTWETNVIGSLNLLESLKILNKVCSAVLITTDKVYKNNEWIYGYRETDNLGGKDPYSASKAAMEIAVKSFRESFCGESSSQENNLCIATARAGNVIGGGDWTEDRIVPDVIRSLQNGQLIKLRNPYSIRPWQHVLDPLSGYLSLAKQMYLFQINLKKGNNKFATSFNFGPKDFSQNTVEDLVKRIIDFWPGKYNILNSVSNFYESNTLRLSSEKAFKFLNWQSNWDYEMSVQKTVNWYKESFMGANPLDCCIKDIEDYNEFSNSLIHIN